MGLSCPWSLLVRAYPCILTRPQTHVTSNGRPVDKQKLYLEDFGQRRQPLRGALPLGLSQRLRGANKGRND